MISFLCEENFLPECVFPLGPIYSHLPSDTGGRPWLSCLDVPLSARLHRGLSEFGRLGLVIIHDDRKYQIKVNPSQVRDHHCHPVVLMRLFYDVTSHKLCAVQSNGLLAPAEFNLTISDKMSYFITVLMILSAMSRKCDAKARKNVIVSGPTEPPCFSRKSGERELI